MVMGRAIFERLMSIRLASRSGSTGSIASSLKEFDSLRDFFASASLVAIVDLPFILLFVFAISLVGGPLAIVPMIAVPVVLVVAFATQPTLARLSEQSFRDGQSKQSVLFEALSGLETIKASRAEARMTARWERALSAQALHSVRSRAISQFALNATALVQQGAQVVIVFYGVLLINDGKISMGALIASVILTGRALTPLAQVAQTLMRTTQARTAYKAIDRLMKADSERPQGRRYLSRDRVEGRLEFTGVTFSYPDARAPSLSDVSLSIGRGEKVAIVGPVGSGKSTLARLAIGLYEPQSGAVRVDGTDIRQIDPGDLRRNVGVCLQDNWLFSGSLRENIAIGAPRASDADVLAVSQVAGVDVFAAKMPEGYDLQVSERGEGLSGGQRQAIALARALMGAPPILILDEPTSAMDVMTEKAVVSRLKTHLADRTVILVTHRPALFDLVDRVIVLQDGKVVADGPRDAILGASAGGGPQDG
jgi:ATP-binding cassette subfamily C protein LapB